MKKVLVVLALAVISFANAQKGTVLVAGNVSYSSQKSSALGSNPTQNYFIFSPKVGYQFHDNWTVGGEAGIVAQKYEYVATQYKLNNYSVGAFVRYSKPLSDLFSIYADLGTGFNSFKETNSNVSTTFTNKSDGFYATITPALAMNIKKGFGLNFAFGGLGYTTRKYDNGNKVNSLNFNFGQSFNMGISKNF